jgi:hypothetical protein
MSSTPTGSSSSGDLPAGTLIAGFRLERVIGRGSRSTVYEAVQVTLDRRVAFKVMHDRAQADRVRRLVWPEHPGAVNLFAVGDSEHGPWLAMRLVPGGTLATQRASLDAVAGALAQAHAQGIVHGDVSTRNVLVDDGRAYLSDFGLAGAGATAEDDCAALAELVRDRSPHRRRRRRAALVVAAVLAVAAVAIVVAAGGEESGDAMAGPPPQPDGTQPLGSELTPGGIAGLACDGRPPSGASLACSISQRELAGKPVVAAGDGTITSWAVRGARGTMALQVLRGRGTRLRQVARSRDTDVPGPGVHVFRARIPVRAGDRIGLDLFPEAAAGIRRSGPRASLDRWIGPLAEFTRPAEQPAGSGLDYELMLRVDVRSR